MEHRSLWQATCPIPRYPPLEWGERTKVLIIGGGIAGILTAYRLSERGIPYILLEQGRILQGTTAGTTAKITAQHGLCYHQLLKKEGAARARLYLQANLEAIEAYQALAKAHPCDFTIEDHTIFSRYDRIPLLQEGDALASLGFEARLSHDLPLPFEIAGGLTFGEQAAFHPLKFLRSIAKDLNIREQTRVLEYRGGNAITERGSVSAEKVIIATHFPFMDRKGLYFMKLYQKRSYLMALKGAEIGGGMYLEAEEGGLSFRNFGEYLLLGGGSHRTGKPSEGWAPLKAFAKEHFPFAKPQYYWAAQDCISLDQIPYIGRYSRRSEELLVASGFNKWGMTGAMVAAGLLADLVEGKENPYQKLFAPDGRLWKKQLLANGLESAKGIFSFSKKRCPHLGCALKWNPLERSWDCPCHGSRFSKKGECLNNPANEDL